MMAARRSRSLTGCRREPFGGRLRVEAPYMRARPPGAGDIMAESWTAARVAVVQAAPVIMDRDATIAKVECLTAEAAAGGARLALFPEAFVPAYPRGLSFGVVVGARSDAGRRTFAPSRGRAGHRPT